MRRHRYRPRERARPEEERLPLDTICTILTRQSTSAQGERNLFSAEVNPEDLVALAERLGFPRDRIRVVDADMGIGAYSTVIGDRPGLSRWLYEELPSGRSRVLLVSQVDRLFRDKWEDQHNEFIRQVATHGGWVICGGRVYNLRRDMDCEQFRFKCKYSKQFVVDHIIRRMLPALHRSAMTGRYPGATSPGAMWWTMTRRAQRIGGSCATCHMRSW